MEECKICGKICKDLKGLSIHLRFTKNSHEKTPQDYYDIYSRKSIYEDICKKCGNKHTQFQSLSKGYREYCKDCGWIIKYDKISASNTGKKRSPEYCQSQSDAMKGENNHRWGTHLTDKEKEHLSNTTKGENSCHFGIPTSEETKQKQREAAKNRPPVSDNTRELMSLAHSGKEISYDIRLKSSITKKFTVKDYQEKYPLLCLEEEMRDSLNQEIGKSGVEFRCKKCNDWFLPINPAIPSRITALETGIGECFLYCSNECKNSCSLFNVKISTILNHNVENNISQAEYQTFRQEVLHRQLKEEKICYISLFLLQVN